MMIIANPEKYRLHKEARETQSRGMTAIHEFALPMLLFGSLGAITWAIRGTDGWGGIDGTIVPGLMWGLLWYYLCWRKGIDARGIVFWLGMGIALGGELGYGQYVSWIQGNFYVGDEIIAVSPWEGYKWFILCGIGWAAPGGILLGWALNRKTSAFWWTVRSLFLVVLVALLYWRTIDWLGPRFLRWFPELLFPLFNSGIYDGQLCKHLGRTVYTNTQNFAFVMWWVAALLAAAVQRDKATLVSGLVIGGGFGIGFVLSALWCLGYVYAPQYIDWWKMWELQAGFNLGLLYVVVLYWAMRQVDKGRAPEGRAPAFPAGSRDPLVDWVATIALAAAGATLLFVAGYEYFPRKMVFLAAFWTMAMCLATLPFGRLDEANNVAERRGSTSFIYAVFLYLFILFHGATSRGVVILELCTDKDVSQYAWPPERAALFAPFAVVVFAGAAFKMRQVMRPGANTDGPGLKHLPARMIDLMTVTGVVGALSIWPAKIGALYALFLCFGIAAFTRLNRRLDAIDAGQA